MTASGSSAAPTSAAQGISATCTGSRTNTAITPLSKFGTGTSRSGPKKITARSAGATIPGTQPGEDPLAFYAALGQEMLKFPAPAADRPLLDQLKAVGVGPGLSPAKAQLSADTLRGLRDAVTQGPNKVLSAALALYLQDFAQAQRLPRDRSRRVGHELHAAGDRRPARASVASGQASRPTRSRCSTTRGSADGIEALRPRTSRRAACRSR